MTKNDAQTFFDQAQVFADKHPNKPFTNYVRFYEVQERFVEHAPALAQALAQTAAYFEAYRKNMASGASFDPEYTI